MKSSEICACFKVLPCQNGPMRYNIIFSDDLGSRRTRTVYGPFGQVDVCAAAFGYQLRPLSLQLDAQSSSSCHTMAPTCKHNTCAQRVTSTV